MIRFTLLQYRAQIVVASVALALVAIVALITGPHLFHLFDTDVATCVRRNDCSGASSAFLENDSFVQSAFNSIVLVVPLIIGIFWGAPLVARELESGTFRLVWTQSVTRRRWLQVKLGVGALLSMAVAGLFSLAASWWSSPFDRVNLNRFSNALFGERAIVPIGYAALAFAIGVSAGVIIRRTLPAMATTFVAYIAARLALAVWIRPHLIAPKHRNFAISRQTVGFGISNGGPGTFQSNAPNLPNAWVYSSEIVNKHGGALPAQFLAASCPRLSTVVARSVPAPNAFQTAMQGCVAKMGSTYHVAIAYQPANRYWLFQSLELAICVGTALLLMGVSFSWVHRRLN